MRSCGLKFNNDDSHRETEMKWQRIISSLAGGIVRFRPFQLFWETSIYSYSPPPTQQNPFLQPSPTSQIIALKRSEAYQRISFISNPVSTLATSTALNCVI